MITNLQNYYIYAIHLAVLVMANARKVIRRHHPKETAHYFLLQQRLYMAHKNDTHSFALINTVRS